MKHIKIIKSVMVLFLIMGCAGGRSYDDQSLASSSGWQLLAQTFTANHLTYHAVMTYDNDKGKIEISFFDVNYKPAKIFKSGGAEAVVVFSDSSIKQVTFKNRSKIAFAAGSHRARMHAPLKKYYDKISTRKEFLKNLSEFALRIQIPINREHYELKFIFPDSHFSSRMGPSPNASMRND